MKKIFSFLFLSLQILVFSQSQDLAKLASGKYLGTGAVFDSKDKLFGYVALYDNGNTSKTTNKYEYVILDKNLNPIANNTFEASNFAKNYFPYMDINNKIVLVPTDLDVSIGTLFKLGKTTMPVPLSIDLKTNTIKNQEKYKFENGKFVLDNEPQTLKALYKDSRAEKKSKGFWEVGEVTEIKEGGFIVSHYDLYPYYTTNNSLMRFDKDKNKLWSYEYNTGGDKKFQEKLKILDKDDHKIFCLKQKIEKKEESYSLIVIDMQTGKILNETPITALNDFTLGFLHSIKTSSYGDINNGKGFDQNLIYVARLIDDRGKYTGFVRFMVDKTTYRVEAKEFTYESIANKIPKLDRNGGVEGGYFLDPRDVFILKDGSTGILLEKSKWVTHPLTKETYIKTTDLIFLHTDSDFKVKDIKLFEKEKTRRDNSDYLFSQYLNDGKDMAFFFRDYAKGEDSQKNWTLFINTLIDGQLKQESLQITSKKNYNITPAVAKEGYILLLESNEKEEYNMARLERLNF